MVMLQLFKNRGDICQLSTTRNVFTASMRHVWSRVYRTSILALVLGLWRLDWD